MGKESFNDGRNSSYRDFEAIKKPSPDVDVPPQASGTEPGPAYRQAWDAINRKDRVDQQLRDWQAQLAAKPRGDQPASSMTIRERLAADCMSGILSNMPMRISVDGLDTGYAEAASRAAVVYSHCLIEALKEDPWNEST